jgi:hypothetical protein
MTKYSKTSRRGRGRGRGRTGRTQKRRRTQRGGDHNPFGPDRELREAATLAEEGDVGFLYYRPLGP